MVITIFEAKGSSKFPISPYGDNTFTFRSYNIKLEDFQYFLSSHYVLNRNYCLPSPKRMKRVRRELEKYLCEEAEYIILDIDKINSKENLDSIFNYFDEKNFSCLFIPSRSYNDEDNFNIKGVIEIKGVNNKPTLQHFLEKIKKDISLFGEVDLSSLNEAAFQAPTQNDKILFMKKEKPIKLPHIKKIEKRKTIHSDNIVKEAIDYLSTLGFRPVEEKKDLIVFEHPNEKTPRGYFLFKNFPFILNHFNPSKSINFLKNIISKPSIKKHFEQLNKSIVQKTLKENKKPDYIVNERYLSISDTFISAFNRFKETSEVFIIKSPMGTGKSNLIQYIITDFQKENKSVLFITNRVSVAKDFATKYGIKIYNEDIWKQGESLVVQLESLWKYDIKDFDCIILDEFVSLLLHSRNKLSDLSSVNRVKLFFALKQKNVILLDAFLIKRVISIIKRKSILFINQYKDDINLFEHETPQSLVEHLYNVMERGHSCKISISCNTRVMAKTIAKICKEKGKKVMLLDSTVSDESKKDVYEKFNEDNHNYWDILIYTPTLTVGVSILNKSDIHYHFDEGNTTDVISALQMIKRNRNAKEIHFFIKDAKKHLIFDKNALIQDFYKNKHLLDKGFMVDFDEFGNMKLSEFGEFVLDIEAFYNLLENSHKESFIILLENQFKNSPEKIIVPSKLNLKEIKKRVIEEEKQEILKLIKTTTFNDIFDYELYNGDNKELQLKKYIAHISNEFKPLKEDEYKRLAEILTENKKFIEQIKNLKLFELDVSSLKRIISQSLSENIMDIKTKQMLKFMLFLKEKGISFDKKITKKELATLSMSVPESNLKRLLYEMGYRFKYNAYRLSQEHQYFKEKLL